MEFASVLINFGIFVATVIAAIIAWRSVNDARLARDDAEQHERQALAASNRAASAAESSAEASRRSASALERQNDLTEAALAPPPESWAVEQHDGPVWAVTNRTGFTIPWVQIGTERGYDETRIRPRAEQWDDVAPDGRLIFDVIDPSAQRVTLRIVWFNPATNQQEIRAKEVRFL